MLPVSEIAETGTPHPVLRTIFSLKRKGTGKAFRFLSPDLRSAS